MNTTELRFRSNRVSDIAARFHADLDALYGASEVGLFVEMLCAEFLGWDRTRYLLHRSSTIDQSDMLRFHWALLDLERYRPIQHIVGHVDFCGCRLEVSPDVLIPRPETEELVARLVRDAGTPSAVLDLCTGSGCIAVALAHAFPGAAVTAVDVSPAALAVARRNAAANAVGVGFVEADVLDPHFDLPGPPFDLVVSNPPYVRRCERRSMSPNVLRFDPALALFVPDDDPLLFYRAVGRFAARRLAPGGRLALEVNEAFGDATCDLLRSLGFRASLADDFRGRPRFVLASR